MEKSIKSILNEKDLILSLYKDGIVKVKNIFDKSFLNEVKLAKDKIFSQFPYGQNDNCEKIIDIEIANKIGYYPIKNLLELDPVFSKIFSNSYINYLAEEILGENFCFTNINMRLVPKTNSIMEIHRDFCGGLSFSLLLDDISVDQGETFFIKNSYKNPSPAFVDLNKFSSDVISTTGNVGDVYFWFPDSWHGRNHNLSDKKTCILMVDIENKNTERKIIQIYKDDVNKKFNLLDKIFRIIGNDPNSLLKHFFYCLFRYKIFKKQIEFKRTIFSRLIFKNRYSQDFSYINYFKIIDFKKILKLFVSKLAKLTVGKSYFLKLKK